MARVTVEDCIDKVENRFELVLLAAYRARALHNGDEATVPIDNDKVPVVALREIAGETVAVSQLKEDFIKSLQLYYEDENVDDHIPISPGEKNSENISTDNDVKDPKDPKEVIFENVEKQDLEKNQNLNTITDNIEGNLFDDAGDKLEENVDLPIEESQK